MTEWINLEKKGILKFDLNNLCGYQDQADFDAISLFGSSYFCKSPPFVPKEIEKG